MEICHEKTFCMWDAHGQYNVIPVVLDLDIDFTNNPGIINLSRSKFYKFCLIL